MRKLKQFVSLLLALIIVMTSFMCVSATETSASVTVTRKGLAISGEDEEVETWRAQNKAGVVEALSRRGVLMDSYINSDINTLQNKLTTYFSGSDNHSVNYLYFTGHGSSTSINIGSSILFSRIRQITDTIPGRFVIFFQSCKSGGSIGREGSAEDGLWIEEQMISNFLGISEDRGSFENNTKYTVFCSCHSSESSTHDSYSYITALWMKGLGYDFSTNHACQLYADINVDSIVTAKELHDYAYNQWFAGRDRVYSPCFYSQYYFETITTSDYILGNPTKSGSIGLADVLLIRQYIAGTTTLTSRQLQLSDVNGDTNVTTADILLIRSYIAGL